MEKSNNNKFLALSFLLILIVFQLSYGFQVLFPSNINWLMSVYHDWGQHYLGWAYFRVEPWHFPIGNIENYNFPAGTNVGFTDSIPLLAIFFKAFSFLLPDTFQYFGIWFLSCHLLIGYFTFKVLNLFTKNYVIILLSVLLVSYNPLLMYRGMHPALCAQWLIIASFYFYLIKPTKQNVDSINKKQLIILILSALINPYLFLMVFGFAVILPFKNYYFDKLISLKQVFFYIFSGLFIVFVSWLLIGMVSFSSNKSMEVENSYGLYGLNLNSFYNSSGWSYFFQALKTYSPRQYEGFSYLGLGIFILILIGIVYISFLLLKKRIEIKKYYKIIPFLFLLILFTLFAITNKVTINDVLLIDFKIPELIIKFGNIFRASGRFIWVLYYAIFLFFLIVFSRIEISEKIKIILLLIICSLQFYDTKLLLSKNLSFGNYEIQPLNEKKWTQISSNFDKIITYPLHDNNLLYNSDYQDWCYIALKNNLPITSGYVARESGDSNSIYKQQIKKNIEEGIIDKNDFYVINPNYINDFSSLLYNQQVSLGFMDGYYYLYSNENTKMAEHKFEPNELQKADSILKKIEKLNKIQTIIKPRVQEDKIQFNIENNTFVNNIINIQGWAFLKNSSNESKDSVFISLSNEKKSYLLKAIIIERPDVASHFNNEYLINAGFKARIFTNKMETGSYTLLLGIKSKDSLIYQSANQSTIELKTEIMPIIIKTLPDTTENIIYNVEENYQVLNTININGWAFISGQSASDSSIQIILESTKIIYSINVFNIQRPDVTSHFNQKVNYDNAGFKLRIDKKKLKKGNYKIGILMKTNDENSLFKRTDKIITIN